MAASSSFSKALKKQQQSLLLFHSRNQTALVPISPLSTADATATATATATTVAASAAASQDQGNQRGRWSRFLLFLPGAITFGLGTWQILRRQDKIEMLEYRRKRLEKEPIKWNEVSSPYNNMDSLEFRKILFEGDFDEGKSIYVGPRSRSISGVTENGYYLITPLIPRRSDTDSLQLPVLVNRGWVPRSWRNKSLGDSHDVEEPINPKTEGVRPNEGNVWWKFWSKKPTVSASEDSTVTPMKVIGVVRGSEKPSIFVPENDPNSGQWFYVDVPMIARACGLPENTLYIEDINEDASARNPYPIPKDVNTLIRFSVMPQDHLNYTITWYSLSAAVTFMAVKRITPKKIKRQHTSKKMSDPLLIAGKK